MLLRHLLVLPLLLAPVGTIEVPRRLPAPAASVPGMLVIGTQGDPALPLPFLSRSTPEADVADQLFLRLGNLRSSFSPSGDQALSPMLAESWRRVDSVTLLFALHPRARWHDGTPVTSRDFVFTWALAKDLRINRDPVPLEPIAAIEAVDPRTVRVRFRRAFQEQLYLAGFTIQPLPAHLLERMPVDSIASSAFAKQPVGNGPYRFERRVPGQQVDLRADTAFFRGRPTMQRVIFRVVADAQTRMNMLLAGELDLIDNVGPAQIGQLQGQTNYRQVGFASNMIVYALLNTRMAGDTSRPSPILSDRRVREALTVALDRDAMALTIFGRGAAIPEGIRSQAWGWAGRIAPAPQQLARARALLDSAGWKEIGPDGIRRRNGVPLRLTAIYSPASAIRTAYSVPTQQQWKQAGIDVVLESYERAKYSELREAGKWDIDYNAINQDPAPMSLTQSWSCASARQSGTSNVAHWCDPVFDRLLAEAMVAKKNPAGAWQAVFARMAGERPAIPLAAPLNTVAVHTRYAGLLVWPARAYLSIWQWRVRPEAALPRDR